MGYSGPINIGSIEKRVNRFHEICRDVISGKEKAC